MKTEAIAFLKKTLTSRKFWAAVAASTPYAVAGDWAGFSNVWLIYAGIQGSVDAVAVFRKPAPERMGALTGKGSPDA